MTQKEEFLYQSEFALRMIDVCKKEDDYYFWERLHENFQVALDSMIDSVSKFEDIRDELLAKNLLSNTVSTLTEHDEEVCELEDFDKAFKDMKSNHSDLFNDLSFLIERGEEGNAEEVLEEISNLLETVQFQPTSLDPNKVQNTLP